MSHPPNARRRTNLGLVVCCLWFSVLAGGAVARAYEAAQEPEPDGQDLLVTAFESARKRGASGEPWRHTVGKLRKRRKATRQRIELLPGQCFTAAAATDATDEDLDLRVRTPSGISLGDGTRGPVARIRYCAGPDGEKVQVQLRGKAGLRFAMGTWGVRGAGAVTPAVPAVAPKPPPRAAPRQLLAERVKTHVDMTPQSPVAEAEVTPDEPLDKEFVLEVGRCYRLVAAVAEPALGVGLNWLGDRPAALKPGEAPQVAASLPVGDPLCPEETGSRTVTLRVHGGAAKIVWQLLGATNPGVAERYKVGGEDDGALSRTVRELHAALEAKPAAVTPFTAGSLKAAESADTALQVKGGGCYTVIASAMPSLRELDMEVLDARGTVVVRNKERSGPVKLTACAELNARWVIRIRAFKGYGQYALQAFGG